MLQNLLVAFGIFEVIAPRPVIELCEQIGLENPEKSELRPYAESVARLEGLVFIWILLRGRDRSPFVSAALGSLGAVAVVHPKPLIRLSQEFAYANTMELELRPWVVPAALALGGLYLLVVFLSGPDHDTESGEEG